MTKRFVLLYWNKGNVSTLTTLIWNLNIHYIQIAWNFTASQTLLERYIIAFIYKTSSQSSWGKLYNVYNVTIAVLPVIWYLYVPLRSIPPGRWLDMIGAFSATIASSTRTNSYRHPPHDYDLPVTARLSWAATGKQCIVYLSGSCSAHGGQSLEVTIQIYENAVYL